MNNETPIPVRLAAALYGPDRLRLSAAPAYLSDDGARAVAHRVAFAYLDWSLPDSPDRRSPEAARRLAELSRTLAGLQREDGTIDSDNLRSPPDTAFVCATLEAALRIASQDDEAGAISDTLDRITRFCDRAADMLAVSGVHTPNHRWVVSGVLAQAYRRTKRPEYREACLDWIGEGIDIDPDGQFSERSSGIYSAVTCQSLILMADGLGMPELLGPARLGLEATLRLIQPGGEVETIASRRQDQAQTANLARQSFAFAYLAALDGDGRFAWAARLGLERTHEAMELLPSFLAYPPSGSGDPWAMPPSAPVLEYDAFFAQSGLARRRRGDLAMSVYGGSDLARDPSLPDASGIAGNPSVLTFVSGRAACRWLRFRARYFDLPAARFHLELFDGETARLAWERRVPYYGPLPRDRRKADGDYALSTGDGRFWSKMSFGERPRVNVCELGARITLRLGRHGCSVEVDAGADARTPAFVELAFDVECEIEALPSDEGLAVSRGESAFAVRSEGGGRWRDITGSPTGEGGRHACLRDGEGEPKELRRWAYEFEAPCGFSLIFDAADRARPMTR